MASVAIELHRQTHVTIYLGGTVTWTNTDMVNRTVLDDGSAGGHGCGLL